MRFLQFVSQLLLKELFSSFTLISLHMSRTKLQISNTTDFSQKPLSRRSDPASHVCIRGILNSQLYIVRIVYRSFALVISRTPISIFTLALSTLPITALSTLYSVNFSTLFPFILILESFSLISKTIASSSTKLGRVQILNTTTVSESPTSATGYYL